VLDVLLTAPPQPEIAPSVPPSRAVALAGLGIALVLALGLWEIFGHATVIAHEGAHAAVALLLGMVVTSVVIHDDHRGKTTWRRPAYLLPLMAGYYGPPLFGLLAAALLVHGSATAMLWVFLFLLVLLLIVMRNLFGFLIVALLAVFFYLTVTYGSASAQVTVACSWAWLLLVGGVLDAFAHFSEGADYADLGDYVMVVPRVVWASLGVLVALACLVLGGAWLFGYSIP
jgi:peptidase M50B-like protein